MGLGDIAEHGQNLTEAISYWGEAREILQLAGLVRRLEEIDTRIGRYGNQSG